MMAIAAGRLKRADVGRVVRAFAVVDDVEHLVGGVLERHQDILGAHADRRIHMRHVARGGYGVESGAELSGGNLLVADPEGVGGLLAGDRSGYGSGGEEVERGLHGNAALMTLPTLYTAGLSLMEGASDGFAARSVAGALLAQGNRRGGAGLDIDRQRGVYSMRSCATSRSVCGASRK